MLFAVSYQLRANTTEESQSRALKLFASWTPPETYTFKAHYANADGSGGLALVETDSVRRSFAGTWRLGAIFRFQAGAYH